MDVRAFQADLMAWYRQEARDLPWRRTRDPYRILVSECMLQQTRVQTVLPRYEAWLARFPDAASLARAKEEEVLAAWSGLGYYRRARALHAAAKQMVQKVPERLEEWRRLPGVGAYTAAAVASIAQGTPAAVVDGNVLRVASRIAALDSDVKSAEGRHAIQAWADKVLEQRDPGAWNQAIMELGATVCTPRPLCQTCPVQSHCASRTDGRAAARPVQRPRRQPRIELRHHVRIVRDQQVLLVREPEGGLLGGLWRLPGGPASVPLDALVRDEAGWQIEAIGPSMETSHRFTHVLWRMQVHDAEARNEGDGRLETKWVSLDAPRGDLAISTAMRRCLEVA